MLKTDSLADGGADIEVDGCRCKGFFGWVRGYYCI